MSSVVCVVVIIRFIGDVVSKIKLLYNVIGLVMSSALGSRLCL
jgi:hypothetical protein